MLKALNATQQEFESACSRTPEYLAWHRLFKREFTALLLSEGVRAANIEIRKPNHFDMSGFFTVNYQTWWFRVEDIRWSKDRMLIRTAQSNRDYTGGMNQWIPLNEGEHAFLSRFGSITKTI
jgi:hypothetical protein